MISKLLICPYFGDVPPWWDLFLANFERLQAHGYDLLLDNDEDEFRERVRAELEVECPPMWGNGKSWDYRPALGVLYADEVDSYDFWGHIDFDVVLGRVERFVTDEFLDGIDIHSNHDAYMNGCWSLYRNDVTVNALFLESPAWPLALADPTPSGWLETVYSDLVLKAESEGRLRKAWTEWQVFREEDLAEVHWEGERLMLRGEEQMMAHFRRTKHYPIGCIR